MEKQLTDIKIVPIDTVHMKVLASESIRRELYEKFTFEVPGYQFIPLYQNGTWNGKINLFNCYKQLLPVGLLSKLIEYANTNGYIIDIDESLLPSKINDSLFDKLYNSFNLPTHITKEDYQIFPIKKGLELKRALLLSPTGSGKSLIIYCLIKTILASNPNVKALVAVTNTDLVSQLAEEFKEYGYDGEINKFSVSKDENSSARIFISTYHSVYKLDKKFFTKFGIIIADEVHRFSAKSTTTLLEKTNTIKYKFGTTATLKDTKCHALALEGMFGPVVKCTTTKDLIDKGKLTKVKIICLLFKYPLDVCSHVCKLNYIDEMSYITESAYRNNAICEIATKLNQNTLVLFHKRDHGKTLYEQLKGLDRPVYYIDGNTDGDRRKDIRTILKTENNALLIASIGTTGTGTNIKNLHNVIFTHPTKSKINVLQAVGRILRIYEGKNIVNVIDIADDFSYKKKQNTTLKHFLLRMQYYQKEQHPFVLKTLKIGQT